jgi:hypothetical protein
MTPKEKAQYLVETMTFTCRECEYESKAKQCALIAVDEILKVSLFYNDSQAEVKYFEEVKKEIEVL